MHPFILLGSVLWPTVAQGFPLFVFLNLIYRNMARLVRWGIRTHIPEQKNSEPKIPMLEDSTHLSWHGYHA